MEWHRVDRPDCSERSVLMTGEGYRCPCCGWLAADDDDHEARFATDREEGRDAADPGHSGRIVPPTGDGS